MANIERSAVEQSAWAITVLTDPGAPVGRKMVAQITLTGIAEEADAHRQRRGAVALLREIADLPLAFEDDERLSWVEIQVDRPTWEALAPYRSGGQ